ncbi:hypothetical protein [Nitratireductor soli]|uniref:hypothetical protein n=1 Tax=Nitratireductor soli TaxID=1670619 RepID=UPI0012FC1307|nr:hypothetical protein [Nitratireductor soli]
MMIKAITGAVLIGVVGLLSGCVYDENYASDPYYGAVYTGGAYYDRDYHYRDYRRYRHARRLGRADRPPYRPPHRDRDRHSSHISPGEAVLKRAAPHAGRGIRIIPVPQDDRH